MSSTGNGRIDPATVASLYADCAGELCAFLVGILRDAELAAEVLQTTFATAVESGHAAREESLRGWLFRVAYHEALRVRRRQKVEQKSVWRVARDGGGSGDSPEEIASRNETAERIRRALTRLPPEQQQVVRMRVYDEKTFVVIAAELGVPLGTVLTRMRLALKKLSDQFPADRRDEQ